MKGRISPKRHARASVLGVVARAKEMRVDGTPGHQTFAEQSEIRRLELVAVETRSLAFELQSCVTDDANYVAPRLHVELRDSITVARLAAWSEYDVAIERWSAADENRSAVTRSMREQEQGRDAPAFLKRVLETRPPSPREGADGFERPELLMRDMPPLPNSDRFVCWEDWLSIFLVARRNRVMAEQAQTEIQA